MIAQTTVTVHDPTLRDGQHAVRHQLDAGQIHTYAAAVDAAGVPVVEVGHGNRLGASSLQVGRSRLSDDEMLATAREALTHSRLATLMLPGWATTADLRNAVRHGWTWCAWPHTAPRPASPNATWASFASSAPKRRACC